MGNSRGSQTAEWTSDRKERIVMLGWRPGVGDMMLEYDDYVGQGSELVRIFILHLYLSATLIYFNCLRSL